MQLKASAPGSLMLLGEHAVLHGQPALVCAIDKRMNVTLTPRDDTVIEINSALGEYKTDLSQLAVAAPFEFVLTAIKKFHGHFNQGFTLNIESEFSDTMGLGSSAAVTAASLFVLNKWLDTRFSLQQLVVHGRDIVRDVQGKASGADIAASIYGGVVYYFSDPVRVEKQEILMPLHAIYSGYKTKTATVIAAVEKKFAAQQDKFADICAAIGDCTRDGLSAIKLRDMKELGCIMNKQQEYMQELGVSNHLLDGMVQDLREQNNISGAKISGSGLGDCVIALGELAQDYKSRVPFNITLQGVCSEKI